MTGSWNTRDDKKYSVGYKGHTCARARASGQHCSISSKKRHNIGATRGAQDTIGTTRWRSNDGHKIGDDKQAQ